jgi:hypothetical protein
MSNLKMHPAAAPTYHQLGLPGLEGEARPLPLPTSAIDCAAPRSLGQPIAGAKDPGTPDDLTHPAGGAR